MRGARDASERRQVGCGFTRLLEISLAGQFSWSENPSSSEFAVFGRAVDCPWGVYRRNRAATAIRWWQSVRVDKEGTGWLQVQEGIRSEIVGGKRRLLPRRERAKVREGSRRKEVWLESGLRISPRRTDRHTAPTFSLLFCSPQLTLTSCTCSKRWKYKIFACIFFQPCHHTYPSIVTVVYLIYCTRHLWVCLALHAKIQFTCCAIGC